jgi:hypothetical protein
MRFFIRIKDGKPFDHPIIEENFLMAFPNINPNNLPSEFAIFERIPTPSIGIYEVYEGLSYEWFGEVVKDYHRVRPMTEAERKETQNKIKNNWEENNGFPSWNFDEETGSFQPPTPYPLDGKRYVWNEDLLSWVEYQITQ